MRSILLFLLCSAAVYADEVLFDIELPITAKSAHALTRTLDHLSPETTTIIIQLKVRTDEELFGRGSSFGVCYELASLLTSDKLQQVRFVAFMPQSIQGHAVLIALACNERILAENAELGAAGIDELKITSTQRQGYREIAKRRNISPAIADKLLDPHVALLQAETDKGTRLIVPADVENIHQNETFADEPTTLIPAGQQGIFSAELARRIHLIDLIANDRVAAVRGLGFKPDDLKVMPIINEDGHAVRVNLNGIINSDKTGAVMRSIQHYLDDEKNNVNFLCLCIDSPGGNLEASLTLASFLVTNIDSAKVRTVAYIPYQARSDAAMIAVACDEIVLGHGAILGGDGARVFSADQIADARRTIKESLAKDAVRSWSLPAAFVDPNIEIFKAEKPSDEKKNFFDYFSEEELTELPDAAAWVKKEMIKTKGELLKVEQGKGEQFFVDRTAKDFAEFKLLYGLEKDPMLVEPTWADKLIQFLSTPGMSATILMIVFIAVMIESKTPGIGIGAFVAVMGLVLFFWLNFLGGTSGWLEVLLFLAGVSCLLLEIFVIPGFGIFGIGGMLAVLVSLVLASQTFVIPQNSYQFHQLQNSLLILVIAGCGVLCFGVMVSRSLERANKPNDTAMIQELERLANYDDLLGLRGVSVTPLVPAGKARIGNEQYDVVSDGNLIEKDSPVEVIEVVGYKIVVKNIQSRNLR